MVLLAVSLTLLALTDLVSTIDKYQTDHFLLAD